MLMNKKEFYTSPEVEAFEVRYEGVVCQSGGKQGSPGQAGSGWTPGEDFNNYGDL